MPINFDGGSLVPNTGPLAQLLAQALNTRRSEQREEQKLQQERQLEEAKTKVRNRGLQLLSIPDAGTFDQQRTALMRQASAGIRAGEAPAFYEELLQISDPEKFRFAVTQEAMKALNASGGEEFIPKRAKAAAPAIKAGLTESGDPGFFAVTSQGATKIPGIRPQPKAPLVEISQGGAREEQKELAKLRAQDLKSIRAKASEAEQQLNSLNVLDAIDVQTGIFEPFKLSLASFAEGLGVDASALANVPAGQAFTAEAGRTVLRIMATQKGPQTDKDQARIAKTLATLGKTPEANLFINSVARSLANRTLEQRDFFNQWLDDKETLKGASSAWNKFKRDVPLISQFVRTKDGLPVFFFRFEERVRAANPGASRDEIIEAWKGQEKEAKERR